MKCHEISEKLGEYWDLPQGDALKAAMDAHIADCEACREEFTLWQESADLIQSTRIDAVPVMTDGKVTGGVMERIYQSESWRLPVAFRSYSFTYKVRRNIMACIAMCLAIFAVSFLYSFSTGTSEEAEYAGITGIIETAHAKSADSGDVPEMFKDSPVASISAPSLLKVGPIQSYTDYLLAASIIGFVFTLLLMNWLSRLRA